MGGEGDDGYRGIMQRTVMDKSVVGAKYKEGKMKKTSAKFTCHCRSKNRVFL